MLPCAAPVFRGVAPVLGLSALCLCYSIPSESKQSPTPSHRLAKPPEDSVSNRESGRKDKRVRTMIPLRSRAHNCTPKHEAGWTDDQGVNAELGVFGLGASRKTCPGEDFTGAGRGFAC